MKPPVLTRYDITTRYPLKEPIRIAHVSDLHERKADDILDLLRAASPDIIVVTGDTYERYDNRPQYDFEHRPIKRLIINAMHYTNSVLCRLEDDELKAWTSNADDFLSRAVSIAPVFMSLGNHEQKLLERDIEFLSSAGITLLDNACAQVEVKGFRFLIGGMSSWDYEEFFEDFAGRGGFRLLLCHHPERFVSLIRDTDIDLTLSGHTHGGQLRIGRRGRGFFVPGQGVFGKYAHGSFFGGRLIVSAGCSNTVAFPRPFNPRELVIVDLKGKHDESL